MIQPIRNQVLVKPFPGDEISAGGILVPESVRKPSNKGTIVAVGNGTKEKPMNLKAGDIGFRVQEWGEPILIQGELHYLMDSDSILAKG